MSWQFLRSPRQYVAAFALVCCGIFASVFCFVSLRSLETQRTASRFHRIAEQRMDSVQTDLQLAVSKVAALGAFCDSGHAITRSSFDAFAGMLLAATPDAGIQALEWAPRVTLAQRAAFARSARAEGLAGFEIRDRLTQGTMTRAAGRAIYFPVLYVQPQAGNEIAVGYDDLAANAVRRDALQRAAASGLLTASGALVLAQETANQYGVILVRPVYAHDAVGGSSASREASGGRLLGFVEGVLRVGQIVQMHDDGSGVELSVIDLSASPGGQDLYLPAEMPPPSVNAFAQSRNIQVAGRMWRIVAFPAPGAFTVDNTYSFLGSALCLLFTLVAAGMLLYSLDRGRQVERQVEERSRELNSALNSLAEAHRGLEESEARYRRLIEDSPDAVVVERQGRIVLANRAALEMFGYEPHHELKEHSILEYVAPEGRELAAELYRQSGLHAMRVPPQEIRVLRRDGTTLDVEFTASSFLEEGSQTIKVVLRDITKRKHDEAVTARLFSAIEQVRESIVITDPDANIVYVNPAFERITGFSRDEVIGKNPSFLKSGRHGDEFYAQMWQTLTSGEAWRGRIINRAKDGHLFTEEATLAPVLNRAGQLINYVAVKRDVTLEIDLQEQLHQAAKMDAIGRLAGGVAHDFNNMLMVIVSYAEMALESLEEDDPVRAQIAQVLRAAHRSFALTRQLLAFSRKQVLAPQVLDCNAILSETGSMVRRLITENIELRCDLASDLWPVKADPDQIAQVIFNLCVNARDAMPNGGSLVLATRNRHDIEPGVVEISVSDTGTGISPEVQKKLFEPFFTTKEKGKGTGLGLATVYGIVQQSGGQIRVQSSPGQGSTFYIDLPRCAESATSPEASARKPLFAARLRVLVVEDEDTLREAIVEQLCKQGYRALAAADGVEALAILGRTPEIGIVVTDLVMPRMGGCELGRLAAARFPHLGFIYISGHTDQASSQREGDRHAVFLQKPFAMSALLDAIAELSGSAALLRTLPVLPHRRFHADGTTSETIH